MYNSLPSTIEATTVVHPGRGFGLLTRVYLCPMILRVYIETTIVDYLASRPQRDIVIAGQQQVTHEWWDAQRQDYNQCTLELIIDEISAGYC